MRGGGVRGGGGVGEKACNGVCECEGVESEGERM